MVPVALSRLSTNQIDVCDLDIVLTAYVVVDFYNKPVERDRNELTLLTAQRFIATQRENAYCRHLVKKFHASDSYFLEDE